MMHYKCCVTNCNATNLYYNRILKDPVVPGMSSVRITLSASLTGNLLLSAIFLLSLQTNPRAFALIRRASSPLVWSMANGEIWKRQRGEMTTALTDLKTEFTIGRAAN